MRERSCSQVVILDFETTGLSSESNRIIEVGAVALDGKRVAGDFSQLMDPGDFLPYQITSITGITDEMLYGMPSPEEVMPDLKEFIGDRIIIAHNASFDSKFLTAEMSRAGLSMDNPILCTLKLARRLIPSQSSYSLSALKDSLGICVEKAHRALDDAKATAFVWRHLYEAIASAAGTDDPTLDLVNKVMNTSRTRVHQVFEANT